MLKLTAPKDYLHWQFFHAVSLIFLVGEKLKNSYQSLLSCTVSLVVHVIFKARCHILEILGIREKASIPLIGEHGRISHTWWRECGGPLSRLACDMPSLGVLPVFYGERSARILLEFHLHFTRILLKICSNFARIFPITLKIEHDVKNWAWCWNSSILKSLTN